MKTIITGASGQYGSLAVRKLLDVMPAEDLILITRSPAKLQHLADLGAHVRFGDFDDPSSLLSAFQGGEKMLLISGTRVGARVIQHKAAIDAAAAANVRHISYTSVVGISPENPAKVVADHLPTEQMMKASGMDWTILRDQHYTDAMVLNMGPNFIQSGIWLSSTAGGKEAPVWREDCVNSAVAVLTGEGHENKTYNITGPELLDFREFAGLLSGLTGHKVDYVETDDAGMYAMFDSMGIPREPVDDQSVKGITWNSDDMVTFEQSIREGFFNVISDDVEKLTGMKPRSVRQMIEENLKILAPA
ncbi:MAG: NmrA-like protein [Novosphingobium lindaniclasticum]|jgi:NAD(P)H dehydrogenase (quinone)|uniref:NAD(P)H-binding protein n=1 Tax=Novosphingobium lindaniclasticum TaxID=1329895 RepID=UPI002409848E|nr:NAD(P)H-binding protein [Novosphingobium lindaniclasticum]MDF2638460.1 NmrA-like protein [Novosphingobium lindaniclasticum]